MAGKVASAVAVGAAVGLARGWVQEFGAAGRLSYAPFEPGVTENTWFDLASLTKPVTALASARLARAGLVDLATPLGALLPELAGTPSASAPLELLLAHRAGLEGHRPLFRNAMHGKIGSRAEMLREAAAARRPDAAGAIPPEGFLPVYSDLGYLLVGEAIARAGGKPLDWLVEELVFAPLELTMGSARRIRAKDAGFEKAVAATEWVAWRAGTVRGLVHDENAWSYSGEAASGHAGLFGTVGAVLMLGRAVVDVLRDRNRSFLTREELWPLVKPRPLGTLRAGFDGKSDAGSSSGAKFGKSTIGHLGFTGTSLWCDVDRQMVGVLLTNRVHPTRENEGIRRARPYAYDRMADWAAARIGRADSSSL